MKDLLSCWEFKFEGTCVFTGGAQRKTRRRVGSGCARFDSGTSCKKRNSDFKEGPAMSTRFKTCSSVEDEGITKDRTLSLRCEERNMQLVN